MSERNNPENSKPKYNNIFIANSIYPELDSIFKVNQTLEEIKVDCYIVLDTNVLLLPYKTGKESLSQIKKTYKKLLSESRLIVPAQVAREFVKNRPDKLIELHQNLKKKREKKFKEGTYPLLESLDEYQEIIEIENILEEKLKEYRKRIDKLLKHVQNWTWNDPISLIYAELFNKDVIFNIDINEEEVKKDLERRKEYTIPPGYKDTSKRDDGVGDLLIWNTILEVGKKYKKSVIFVSGEKKGDWWHTSGTSALYPRYELVDEFRRYSEGQSFHLIELSHLLELYGASENVINEIKEEEKQIVVSDISSENSNFYFNKRTIQRYPGKKLLFSISSFLERVTNIAKENIKIIDVALGTNNLKLIALISKIDTHFDEGYLLKVNEFLGEGSIDNLQEIIMGLKLANGFIETVQAYKLEKDTENHTLDYLRLMLKNTYLHLESICQKSDILLEHYKSF